MNKLIFFLIITTFIALACTPKASLAVTAATIPTETTVSNDMATIEAGHIIFTTKCTRCHKEKPIRKWTYQKLRPVLGAMVKKADLNTTEIGQITAYVHANAKK